MPSLSNIQRKSNGRVSPLNEAAAEQITNASMSPVETKKGFFYRLLKKKDEEKPTKPQGFKLKAFEIVSERSLSIEINMSSLISVSFFRSTR